MSFASPPAHLRRWTFSGDPSPACPPTYPPAVLYRDEFTARGGPLRRCNHVAGRSPARAQDGERAVALRSRRRGSRLQHVAAAGATAVSPGARRACGPPAVRAGTPPQIGTSRACRTPPRPPSHRRRGAGRRRRYCAACAGPQAGTGAALPFATMQSGPQPPTAGPLPLARHPSASRRPGSSTMLRARRATPLRGRQAEPLRA
jgi:hypothetical protein